MEIKQAFETIREAATAELEKTQRAGAAYFTQGDTGRVRETADRVEQIKQMLQMLGDLQSQWRKIMPAPAPQPEHHPAPAPQPEHHPAPARVNIQRTPRGEKTPQDDFYIPILKVLVEMGGRGRTGLVIDRVGELMEGVLNDLDREIMKGRRDILWRNTAAWARNDLKNSGYLSDQSPNGIWEITAEGRSYLANRKR
ncbi:MAG: hypothetical protein JW987_00560 [Anaerolineaceae bacterium]|nr:hypothetical protein [Anaerolineaceae bacterium]